MFSFKFRRIPSGRVQLNFPFGPSTSTSESAMLSLTLDGISIGKYPTRDILFPLFELFGGLYQTWQRTSPPTFDPRQALSVITPLEVDKTATPKPPKTRGIEDLST